MRGATGIRQTTCPWQSLRDPFVIAVLRAYRWFKAEQLLDRYPRCPEALMRGLEAYDGALNAVQAHDMRAERKRIDAENARRMREAEGGHMRPPARPMSPPVRRQRPPR